MFWDVLVFDIDLYFAVFILVLELEYNFHRGILIEMIFFMALHYALVWGSIGDRFIIFNNTGGGGVSCSNILGITLSTMSFSS